MRSVYHGDYLVQLTQFGMMNCFLVRGEDGLTLIDTLMPGQVSGILNAARELDAPIVRAGITHAHPDHLGSLDAIVEQLPSLEVGISAREARLIDGDFTPQPGEPDAKPRGISTNLKSRPAHLLHDGDRFGPLEVVATPGHTPGHIAFYDWRDGTLIVGDALQTAGGITVVGWPRLIFPIPSMATWHRLTALESALRMRALNPSRIAAGHGPVVENPNDALDRAIDRASRRA